MFLIEIWQYLTVIITINMFTVNMHISTTIDMFISITIDMFIGWSGCKYTINIIWRLVNNWWILIFLIIVIRFRFGNRLLLIEFEFYSLFYSLYYFLSLALIIMLLIINMIGLFVIYWWFFVNRLNIFSIVLLVVIILVDVFVNIWVIVVIN